MKSLLILLIITLSATLIVSQEDDDEMLVEYFKTHRVPRTASAFQNLINRYKEIIKHNLRFNERLETFNQTLNDFSQLSLEEIANYKLGALEDDPKEVRNRVNVTDDRFGRAISPPEEFLWPASITGKVKSQGSCGRMNFLNFSTKKISTRLFVY